MIDPVIPDLPVELSAVLADDELVDRLSRRAGTSESEPLARLLASWVSQVDAAAEGDLAAEPVQTPVLALAASASRRRSRFTRGSRLAVAVTAVGVGLGSLTGVAAAVTGDPLAPYRPVISSVLGGSDAAGSASDQATSADPGTSVPGTAEGTTQRSRDGAARPGAQDQHMNGEHPADAHGPAAAQAARDGWLARWEALPPQAVGPDLRHVLDAQGGPSRADPDLRGPGSNRADEVRRDGDEHRGNGSDEGAEAALRHRAGGSDDGAGSDGNGAATTPPGHQVPRR